MYKNKNGNRNNICGINISLLRQKYDKPISQRQLADMMQLAGIDLDKNAIQRIESGQRFVTDIELDMFSKVLKTPVEQLLMRPHKDREPGTPDKL